MKNTHFKPQILNTFCVNTYSLTLFISIFLSCFSLAVNVNAQGVNDDNIPYDNIPYDKISSGSLFFKNETQYYPALTQNSDYQVNVNGLLARVNFTQTFKNSSDKFLEAVYVFPLIDDASVSSMIMEIGERRIVGKIKEKKQAQQLYTKAKKQGKKVSLVSQQRPNLFTTKLANIAPGETIKISLGYTQSITLNDETFALRIPLTLTPRYIPGISRPESADQKIAQTTVIKSNGWAINNVRVPDASEITPFQTRLTTNDNEDPNYQQLVKISVNLNGGLPLSNITSLYHKITQTQQNNTRLITLGDKMARLDQDFVLQWQLSQGNTPKAAFFQQADPTNLQSDYQYGLLMLMPPNASNEKAINKEVVYIIDTSGSMGGVAIRQAKESLIKALDFLKPTDTFNIIAFNTNSQRMFSLNKQANAQNLTYAKQWLSRLVAGGGTNMYPAIEQALVPATSENAYRQVIFITDGSVGNEAELLSLIDNKLGNTRLHTVGIGSAPNGYFMSEAAKVGRGTYRYIGSINEVSEQMTKLFNQISKPLMKNIELTWPAEQIELFPNKVPDLYAGQPLLISARWLKSDNQSEQGSSIIKITGQLANDPWEEQIEFTSHSEFSDTLSDTNTLDNGVAQWWAKNKIDHLTTLHRRSAFEGKPELQSKITQLALQHQLLSPYTSFIAIEEKVSREQDKSLKANDLRTKAIKNLMPKGSTQAIPLANTALGITQSLYIGLFFMMTAILMQFFMRKRVAKPC